MAEPPKHCVATDAAVFSVVNGTLKVLLIKRKYDPFKGMFALPGGFLEDTDKSLNDCVKRELYEETGVDNIFLKMLHAYGDVGRDPRGRVVTVAYLAVISSSDVELNKTKVSEDAEWIDVSSIKSLAFDHSIILAEALDELRHEIMDSTIMFQLLKKRFTLTEMQKAYEVILGKPLDKRNFRKWIKQHDVLFATDQTKMEGVHRPARLYEFKDKRYKRF